MSRAVIGNGSIRVPRDAKEIQTSRVHGYKAGGAVTPEKAVHKHEKHLHRGEPETKLKKGGAVKGKHPKKRLDRKARGGDVDAGEAPYNNGPRTAEHQMKQPEQNYDAEGPPKRARGGRMHKPHRGSTNVIVNAGGAQHPGAPDPMAMQQAKQEGAKMGAMAVLQKLKGAGAGGPPLGAPGPGPAGVAGPSLPGAGAPPPGPGMAPPFRKKGGRVAAEVVKVKAHTRRRGGACE